MIAVERDVPLAPLSTLHVGGRAQFFVRVSSLASLRAALAWAEDHEVNFFLLGGGANFFCRDEGFRGLVIKLMNREITVAGREVTADAGALTRLVVHRAVTSGLRGLEHLAGIPGTVGGAVRGNAGSFGTETADRIARVKVLQRTKAGWEEVVLTRNALTFAYRDSTFKRAPGAYVILQATFVLARGDRAEGEQLVAQDHLARREKQPYEFPSVGSIFLNPSPDRSSGRLLEEAGLKGTRVGGAEISTKHANFIVNRGGATATDVLALMAQAERAVRDRFGILLEPEIVIL